MPNDWEFHDFHVPGSIKTGYPTLWYMGRPIADPGSDPGTPKSRPPVRKGGQKMAIFWTPLFYHLEPKTREKR